MAGSADDDRTGTFEAALQRLAELVAGLESGSLGLSESITAYEHGVGILKRLHDELAAAEERVKVLVRIDDDGRPVLEDAAVLDERGAAGGETAAAGSPQTAPSRPQGRGGRAKTTRPRQLPGMDESEQG